MYWLIPYVRIAFEVYNWLIIIRVFLSWFPHDPHKPIFRFIYEITEPVLAPLRKIFGGRMALDFSPVIAIIALQFIEMIIIDLLRVV